MASRTSTSIGVGITITVLGLVSLALFVLTIVFLSKYQSTERQLTQQQQEQAEILRADERNSDAVQRLKDVAKKENKSLVGYLAAAQRTINTRVTGSSGDTPDQLLAKIDQISATSNLSDVVSQLRGELTASKTALEQADKDRQAALENLKIESDRVATITASHNKTVEAMNADIARYRAEIDQYRQGVNDKKKNYDESLDKSRAEAATREAQLSDRIKKLENENLQLIDRVAQLTQAKNKDILKPAAEETLVDGTILAIQGGESTVTIDRGRKDKLFLGMTFAVYADATAIKPDAATGEYPRGKATIEVINVGETSSTCRITSEVKGNPIVRGDVVANALYDPSKVYTFLVYGNFDANSDGRGTAAEGDQVKALIEGWGGKVASDLTGNVDFLVLGERPQVPPRPGAGAPFAVVQEFIRLDTAAQRYDELFQKASATSIPVLNENRLYTLIGKR